jgi:hypothetical protein
MSAAAQEKCAPLPDSYINEGIEGRSNRAPPLDAIVIFAILPPLVGGVKGRVKQTRKELVPFNYISRI